MDWRLTAHEIRLFRLLVWLVEQDNGSSITAVAPFYDNDESRANQARDDVRDLEDRGFVRPVIGGGGCLGTISAMVEPAGRSTAGRLQREWRHQPARRAACRSALVAWLYDVDATETPNNAVTWDDFPGTEHGSFYGDRFTADELDRAAAWLQRRDLIQGTAIAERQGPITGYLTDRGVTCAEQYACDVNAFVHAADMEQRAGATFNVNGQNVQVATGNQSQQTITIGQTAQDLALALRGLTEMVQQLGFADDGDDLNRLTEEAVTDITSPRPTGAPARGLLERLRAVASRQGNQALTTAITLGVTAAADDVAALIAAVGG